MEQRLFELLHQCTMRISVPGKTGQGSGFFVAPGLILTCAHVLKAAQSDLSPIAVYWNGQSYPAQITKLQQDHDLALLQVHLSDHPCVYLHEEAIPFDALYSYGYPDDHPDGDPATFTLEGKAGIQGNQIKFKTGQVRPGLSGAPLLNVRTGYVCGVVQLTRDRNNDLGGRAIPITNILRVFPDLISQQQQFHQQDGRWTNCLWEVVARTRYLESMIRRYSSITLPIGPAQGFSLQAIFQPLKLRRDPLAAEDLARDERRALLGEPRYSDDDPRRAFPESRRSSDQVRQSPPVVIAENADEALKKSSKRSMVILGGPGTGKTTLLEYLVGDRAQKARINPSAPLPVFILLPDLARSGKTLKEYLQSIVQDMMIDERYTQILWKAIEQGQAFVCLDSLDEVAPKLRPEKIRLINEWASSTNSIYIIGSRFTDYKGGQLRSEQFTEWELQPMSSALRMELAKRLLPELYRLMPPKKTPAESSTFVSALERHEQAAAWGENPLLFSLAAMVFVRTGGLPLSRTMLYQQVVDAVLETREPDRSGRELLRSVLACLALELYQEKGRTFTQSDLLRYLRTVRKRQDEQWDTEELAQRIIDSGVLEVVAHDTYGFRHQTFQEYLAAVELAGRFMSRNQALREEAWNLAWSKRTYSRWTELLRLMVGVLTQEMGESGRLVAQRWLRVLMDQRNTPEGDPGNLGLMLAIKSLSEVSEASGKMDVKIVDLGKEVVSVWVHELLLAARNQTEKEKQQYERLRSGADYLSGSAEEVAVEQLVRAFEDHDKDVRSAVVRALVALHGPIDFLLKALHDQEVRYVAVQALKAQGERIPIEPIVALHNTYANEFREIVEALKAQGKWGQLERFQLSMQDQWFLRGAIMEVLGAQGKRVPIELLLSALQDENFMVRRAATGALEGQGERLSIEFLLTALQSPDIDISQAAIKALKTQWERIPMEFFLTSLRDGNERIRRAAVEVLGALGERVPIEFFLTAFRDEDDSVRRAAVEVLGALGERVSISTLLSALHDNSWAVQDAATNVLKMQGERVPIELFLTAFHDENDSVRRAMVEILGAQEERVPIEFFLTALHDENESVRSAAVEVLSSQGERVPIEGLIAALHDKDKDVRSAAAEVLGAQGERVPIESLLKDLHDKNMEVYLAVEDVLKVQGDRLPVDLLLPLLEEINGGLRQASMEVLGEQGVLASLDLLLTALHDHDNGVRLAALGALEAQGERAPIQPLLAAMYDEDEDVKWAAVEALRAQGERVPNEPLLAAITDEDNETRSGALRILMAQQERVPVDVLFTALHDENEKMRQAAEKVLIAQQERVPFEDLLRALQDENKDVRLAALKVLRAQGERVPIEPLLTILDNENESVRTMAIAALGAQGVRAPLEPLLMALQDENVGVRTMAIVALGAQGVRAPLEPLLIALQDENAGVRWAAVRALGMQGQRAPLEPLLMALQDENKDVRNMAVKVLGIQGERIPINDLLTMLWDEEWDVQQAVVEVLWAQRERVPIDPLLAALQDWDASVRLAALQALGTQRGRIPLEPLLTALRDEQWAIRCAALETFVNLGEQIPLEPLLMALQDKHEEVRCAAVEALGVQGEQAPLEPLLTALQDKAKKVRHAAVKALGVQGNRVPIEPLFMALYDKDEAVCWAAKEALEAQGERVPLELLLMALQDKTEKVRRAAVQVLGTQGKRISPELLLEFLGDEDSDVRIKLLRILKEVYPQSLFKVAAEATGILQGQPAGKIFSSLAQSFIARFIGSMEHTSPILLEKLTDLLDWPFWQVRMNAAQALGKLRRGIPDTAIHRLLELRRDPNPKMRAVREAVDNALAEILSLETGIEDD